MSGDYPNYSIVEIGHNTEKNPVDLKRLAVSNSSEKPSANAGVKNSQKGKIIINLPNSGFCRPGGPQSENQRKRKGRHVLRTCQRTKKKKQSWKIKVTVIQIIIGALGTISKTWQRAGKVGNQMSQDHPNYNIKKSPKDLRRLAVTKIPQKDYISKRWCRKSPGGIQ